MVEVWSCL